jgi:hypothetical protein
MLGDFLLDIEKREAVAERHPLNERRFGPIFLPFGFLHKVEAAGMTIIGSRASFRRRKWPLATRICQSVPMEPAQLSV